MLVKIVMKDTCQRSVLKRQERAGQGGRFLVLPIPHAHSSSIQVSQNRIGRLSTGHLSARAQPSTSPSCCSLLTKGRVGVDATMGNVANRAAVGSAVGKTDSGIFSLELNQIWTL